MRRIGAGRVYPPGPAAGLLERRYYVYILSTPDRSLYLGVTNDLKRRLFEHRLGAPRGCNSPLGATRLVYYEITTNLRRALARKSQLEGWNRHRKWRLIGSVNPDWKDLLTGLRERKETVG